MKLIAFSAKGSKERRLGIQLGDRVLDVALAGGPKTMEELVSGGPGALDQVRKLTSGKAGLTLADLKILAPLERPGKIMAIGKNYAAHAKEQGEKPPTTPILFTKFSNCIIGPDEPILLPPESIQVDYEAELAVVIGKRCRRVKKADALSVVFGYTICHDVSARDIQFGDGQWSRGKSFDTFGPLGPCIVTPDEIPDPQKLAIKLELNGKVMQDDTTANMIFSCAVLIEFLSAMGTLEPGDIISTGTPDGVGVFRKPPVFLKAGDVTKITIEKIGTLSNPIASEK